MTEAGLLPQVDEYRGLLLGRLEQAPGLFADLVAGLPEPEWHRRRGSEGASLHALAVHLRDAEALAYWPRIQRILTEDGPLLDQFPHHRWSLEAYQPAEPLADVLADFTRTRLQAVAQLSILPRETWSRVGFHPPSGPRTLAWWVERLYTHAHRHLLEIQAISAAGPVAPPPDPYAHDLG